MLNVTEKEKYSWHGGGLCDLFFFLKAPVSRQKNYIIVFSINIMNKEIAGAAILGKQNNVRCGMGWICRWGMIGYGISIVEWSVMVCLINIINKENRWRCNIDDLKNHLKTRRFYNMSTTCLQQVVDKSYNMSVCGWPDTDMQPRTCPTTCLQLVRVVGVRP